MQPRRCLLLSVAVIDDHPATRLGIIAALKNVSNLKVIGEAGSGPELAALLQGAVPDVLLLDISMPDFDVFLAVPRMQKQHHSRPSTLGLPPQEGSLKPFNWLAPRHESQMV